MVESRQNTKQVETMYGSFHTWEGDLITEQLEQYSAHTRNELAMLRSFIGEGGDIIDIGGHIGTFAIPFSVFTRGNGKIYTFEANPRNYSLLTRNIDLNDLGGVVIPANAVVSEQENIDYSPSLPDGGNSGMYYFKPVSEQSEVRVASVNIDKWYDRLERQNPVQLIKIDVEGAEIGVLRSCRKLIRKYRPVLYIEINNTALQRFNTTCRDIEDELAPLGYRFFRNTGERNSTNDNFTIGSLESVCEGGDFFDLLAVHPADTRFPGQKYRGILSLFRRIKEGL